MQAKKYAGAISSAIRRVTQSAISPSFMRQLILRGARSPEGRLEIKICWQQNMHSKPMMQAVVYPMIAAIEMACLRDLKLDERDQQEVDEVLLAQVRKMVANYSAAFYNQKDILCLFDMWRGRFKLKEFDRFINKHQDRQLATGLALILGHKFALDGNPKVARYILDTMLNDKDANPVMVRELKRKLARMERDKIDDSEQENKQ